jgi:KDO2-lipid IV(A) lauroyltransferase
MASAMLQQWPPYAALRVVAAAMHLFGVEQNLRTAATVGDLFGWLGPQRVNRAVGNVRRAFPDRSEAECREIALASIQHMFQLFLVDSVAGPQQLNRRNWVRHVTLGDMRETIRLLLGDRPALFLTGHLGNWEFLGLALSLLGFRMSALARPLDNPHLNAWLLGMRERRGLEVITKWGATTEVQRRIEAGGRVGFIADQNAGDDGVFVPFFGRLASTYKSIGLLALRYRVPIVVGAALRRGASMHYGFHTVDRIEPHEAEAAPDPLFYVTARFSRALEQAVRLAPEQYLWIHRRWKSRPPWVRKGQAMPERFRNKLLELPWMDQAQVDALVAAEHDA